MNQLELDANDVTLSRLSELIRAYQMTTLQRLSELAGHPNTIETVSSRIAEELGPPERIAQVATISYRWAFITLVADPSIPEGTVLLR